METDVPPQRSITEGVRPFDRVACHFKVEGTAIGQRASDHVSLDDIGAFAATHADFPAIDDLTCQDSFPSGMSRKNVPFVPDLLPLR